jgi:hypothetical protein
MGEPLGDSATYRKVDGGLILGGGGGGGGSAPANTTSQTTQTTDLPDWAKPYAQDVLSKGKAVTDINQNPYQPYGGERIAGFSDLQNQSFQGAQNMQPSQQLGMGTGMATGAGIGGMSIAGQANPYGFQNQVGGYMNPYMNQILAPQLAEANRQYDIGATKQQSAATQAGAFGGSREAIMAAENERNRNTGLNQIYGQGLNTAYTNAQNQYNQNLQNQLAGYGLMGQSASTLGQLGQNQYTQNMGINALQNQYGAQQQAQQQKGLDTAYNDFLTQKNYPYQQLSYMANLVRGTPMGMNTASQVYQAPPSTAQTLGALGLGAYGVSKMAGGGEVRGYDDGGSVTSENNVRSISKFLPPQQLPASYQMAAARGDLDAEIALQKQMAENKRLSENATIDRGLGSAFNALPPETQDGVVRAAGGGILAFQDRGLVPSTNAEDEDERLTADERETSIGYTGTPTQQAMARGLLSSQERLMSSPQYDPLTRRGRLSAQKRSFEELKEMAGPDPYGAYEKTLAEDKETSAKVLEQNKGLAALQAIPAILQGGNAVRGFGAAAGTLGAGLGKAAEADRAEKRYLNQMQFHLADAKRKENMGLYGEARKDVQDAEVARLNAVKENRVREAAVGTNFAKGVQALRAPAGSANAGKVAPQTEAYQTYYKYFKDLYPEQSDTVIGKMAMDKALEMKAPGLPGVTARTEATADEKARERTAKRLLVDTAYNEAQRKKDKTGMDARRAEILAEEQKGTPAPYEIPQPPPPPAKGGAPKGGAPKAAAGPITPAAFAEKWATLKQGQTLVGPDGLTYTKQ